MLRCTWVSCACLQSPQFSSALVLFFSFFPFIFFARYPQHCLLQWNLDLTKCQGTEEICSLYQTPRFNELWGKQGKCSLYRGIVNNKFPAPNISESEQFL